VIDVIGTKILDTSNGTEEGIEECGISGESCSLSCEEGWGVVNGAKKGDASTGLVCLHI
jgi:hypothetical protein